jgi:hypothetical protein
MNVGGLRLISHLTALVASLQDQRGSRHKSFCRPVDTLWFRRWIDGFTPQSVLLTCRHPVAESTGFVRPRCWIDGFTPCENEDGQSFSATKLLYNVGLRIKYLPMTLPHGCYECPKSRWRKPTFVPRNGSFVRNEENWHSIQQYLQNLQWKT